MANCIEHTVLPELPNDPCNGKRYDTRCIYSEDAFTLLDLPINTSLDVILNAMVTALNSANTRLNAQDALIADLEARIIILEP
jgi:hypothetical protein